VQSSSQIITTNKLTSSFYRPDALPVAQPTVSKNWREKISHSMDLLTPSSLPVSKMTCTMSSRTLNHSIPYPSPLGVFQLCLWPLIAPGYLGGGLPCFSSASADASTPRLFMECGSLTFGAHYPAVIDNINKNKYTYKAQIYRQQTVCYQLTMSKKIVSIFINISSKMSCN